MEHQGKYIFQEFEKLSISVAEFAKRCATSKSNMDNIFERETIKNYLLIRIGKELGEDLVARFGNTDEDKKKVKEELDDIKTKYKLALTEINILREQLENYRKNDLKKI